MKVAKLAALVMVLMTATVLVNAAPPGGGSFGSGGGAPIDGGATLFLGALAAYAYKKLKGKSE